MHIKDIRNCKQLIVQIDKGFFFNSRSPRFQHFPLLSIVFRVNIICNKIHLLRKDGSEPFRKSIIYEIHYDYSLVVN